MLYGLKTFGRYHFFKSEQERDEFVKTLPEWEAKYVQCWTTILSKEE